MNPPKIEWRLTIKLTSINGESQITVPIEKEKSVGELKQQIRDMSRQKEGWGDFEPQNQRLIYSGVILADQNKLQDIRNLKDGSVILIQLRLVNNQAEPAEDQLQQNAETSQVAVQFNQMLVYQRNFASCIKACQRNVDPQQRQRHDFPEAPVTGHPTVSDLGEFTNDMASSLLTWSHCLEDLGQLLIEDKPVPADQSSVEYQHARRCIQNNFDASRYISPEMSFFSRFVVPLGRPAPRQLRLVQPRPRAVRRGPPARPPQQ